MVDAAVKVRLYSSQSWSKWSSEQSVADIPLGRISFLSDHRIRLTCWFFTAYIMILVYSGICPLELHLSLNASGDMSETFTHWTVTVTFSLVNHYTTFARARDAMFASCLVWTSLHSNAKYSESQKFMSFYFTPQTKQYKCRVHY